MLQQLFTGQCTYLCHAVTIAMPHENAKLFFHQMRSMTLNWLYNNVSEMINPQSIDAI